jgi:pseudouridine-5'-phosphate glycosidase
MDAPTTSTEDRGEIVTIELDEEDIEALNKVLQLALQMINAFPIPESFEIAAQRMDEIMERIEK